jgi:single-strand DNA-binding protein
MNKVILCGNLGKDPELKQVVTESINKPLASFSIATRRNKDHSDWHNVVAWDKNAEIAMRYLKKGVKVLIEGSIKPNNYEKDGVKHYSYNISADRIHLIDSSQRQSAPSEAKTTKQSFDGEFNMDDVPF